MIDWSSFCCPSCNYSCPFRWWSSTWSREHPWPWNRCRMMKPHSAAMRACKSLPTRKSSWPSTGRARDSCCRPSSWLWMKTISFSSSSTCWCRLLVPSTTTTSSACTYSISLYLCCLKPLEPTLVAEERLPSHLVQREVVVCGGHARCLVHVRVLHDGVR